MNSVNIRDVDDFVQVRVDNVASDIVNIDESASIIYNALLALNTLKKDTSADRKEDENEYTRQIVRKYINFLDKKQDAQDAFYRLSVEIASRSEYKKEMRELHKLRLDTFGMTEDSDKRILMCISNHEYSKLNSMKKKVYQGLDARYKCAKGEPNISNRINLLEACARRAMHCYSVGDKRSNDIFLTIVREMFKSGKSYDARKWMLELKKNSCTLDLERDEDIIENIRDRFGAMDLNMTDSWSNRLRLQENRNILYMGWSASKGQIKDSIHKDIDRITLAHAKALEIENNTTVNNYNNAYIEKLCTKTKNNIAKLPEEMRHFYENSAKSVLWRLSLVKNGNGQACKSDDVPWLSKFSDLVEAILEGEKNYGDDVPISDAIYALNDRINKLSESIVGQERQIDQFKIEFGAVLREKRDIFSPPRLIVLNGPSGCGKTEIANLMGEALYGDKSLIKLLSVSDTDSSRNLFGSKAVYVGSSSAFLAKHMMQEKTSRVVFIVDEMEKADEKSQNGIAQLFGGKTSVFDEHLDVPMDLSKCFFIFISNCGYGEKNSRFLTHLADRFAGSMVDFKPLSIYQLKYFARKQFKKWTESNTEFKGVTLRDDALDAVLALAEEERIKELQMEKRSSAVSLRHVEKAIVNLGNFFINRGREYLLGTRRAFYGQDIAFIKSGINIHYEFSGADTSIFDVRILNYGDPLSVDKNSQYTLKACDKRSCRETDFIFNVSKDTIKIFGSVLPKSKQCTFSILPVDEKDKDSNQSNQSDKSNVLNSITVKSWPISRSQPLVWNCSQDFWTKRAVYTANAKLDSKGSSQNITYDFSIKMQWGNI